MSKPSKAAIEAAMKIKRDCVLEFGGDEDCDKNSRIIVLDTDKAAAIIDEAAKGLVEAADEIDKFLMLLGYDGGGPVRLPIKAALADWRTE